MGSFCFIGYHPKTLSQHSLHYYNNLLKCCTLKNPEIQGQAIVIKYFFLLELGRDAVIVYAEKYFAVFDVDEYTDIILHLREEARLRMCRWIKRFRRDKIRAP
jgi:hypothetical protein